MLDVIRTGVAYSEELMEYILEDSENSDIAKPRAGLQCAYRPTF